MENKCKIKKICVHNGVFHADDVTVVALMRLLGVHEYERVNIAPEEAEDILIADIGLGKYDHHQIDAKRYPDGGKYASIGLVWEDFGEYLIEDKKLRDYFRDKFIRPIEKADNGEGTCSLANVVNGFLPMWDDTVYDYDKAFPIAVDFINDRTRKPPLL